LELPRRFFKMDGKFLNLFSENRTYFANLILRLNNINNEVFKCKTKIINF